MVEDTVRVLRVVEYEGPRGQVEETLINSIHGTAMFGELRVTAATLCEFPQVLDEARRVSTPGEIEELTMRLASGREQIHKLRRDLVTALEQLEKHGMEIGDRGGRIQ